MSDLRAEGSTKGLKCIGKGSFSTVYKKNRNTVLIKSSDNVKECMALGWFPSSRLFPTITRIACCDDEVHQIYEQKFYEKVRKVKHNVTQFEYEFYMGLRGFSPVPASSDSFNTWRERFQGLPGKFSHKKTALCEAVDALTNYGGDVCFEISPRNIAIKNNKIVLLDCFFFSSALERKRKNKYPW